MTMKQMDQYFEERGFEVKRVYNSDHKDYTFTISKDGCYRRDVWKYPANQGMFMKKMIADFEKYGFEKKSTLDDIKTVADLQKWASENHYTITLERHISEPDVVCVEGFGNEIRRRVDLRGRSNEQTIGFIKKLIRVLEDDEIDENSLYPSIKHLYAQYALYAMGGNGTPKFTIKKVIFNEPATIVLWADGTKTVVKATNEEYDPEKGLAMAISKKALGNKREYYHTFLHWLKKYDEFDILQDKAIKQLDEEIERIRNLAESGSTVENTAGAVRRLAKAARDATGTLI